MNNKEEKKKIRNSFWVWLFNYDKWRDTWD